MTVFSRFRTPLSRVFIQALAGGVLVLTLCAIPTLKGGQALHSDTDGQEYRSASRAQASGAQDRRPAQHQPGKGLPKDALVLTTEMAPGHPNVIYIGTVKHGVFRSTDGGQSFQAINRGLPPAVGAAPVTPVQHLVIDSQNPDVAYVATEVDGIYKTTDGGQTWEAANNGLPGRFQYRTYHPLLAIDPTHPNTIYAVIGYPVHSHLIQNKVYKSTDGGEQWHAIYKLPDNEIFQSLTLVEGDVRELVLGHKNGVIRFKDTGQPLDEPAPRSLPKDASPAQTPMNMDVGDIAVIEDDGALVRNFDLSNRTIEFVPQETGGYRAVEIASAFETDFGTPVPLTDDGSARITPPFPFSFYGIQRSPLFINANGSLTFVAEDPTQTPSSSSGFSQFRLGPPRIAALWINLNPASAGGVFINMASDPARLVVTWDRVPQAGLPDSNTFQIVLFSDGRIRLNYGQVTAISGLVGISPGQSRRTALTINFSRELPQSVETRSMLEFFTGEGFDIQAVAQRFYQTHDDLYDQLLMFGAGSFRATLTGSPFVVAFHRLIQNDVMGMGLPTGALGGGPPAFGSAERLQGIVNLNTLAIYPDDPHQEIFDTFTTLDTITHEVAHRWLAYIFFDRNGNPSPDLLRRDLTHWNFFFDSDASVLFGNRWRDNNDGTFTTVGVTEGYGPLDLYLMGLRPPADMAPVFYVNNPTNNDTVTRDSFPQLGVTVSGSRADVSLAQITTANGPRQPGFGSSPTSFTQAFILVVPEGQNPALRDLAKLERFRLAFEPHFNQLTGGRAVVNTSLAGGTADLMISDLTVSPPMAHPGETVTVSFTITNQGTAAAGLALHEIRLSGDEVIDSDDALLKKLTTSSLGVGESVSLSNIPVTIPLSAPSGAQFIALAIDAGGATREPNRTNNQAVMPITVEGSGMTLTLFSEREPNNQPILATPITPDAIITATLRPARDVDYYSFMATAGQTVTIDINAQSLSPSSPANTLVTLVNTIGTVFGQNDDFAGSPDSFLQLVIPQSGQYFIRVQNVPTQQGGPAFVYQAVVLLRSTGTIAESEPNNSFAEANMIAPDVIISGVLNPVGDEDFFVVNAGTGQILRVEVAAQMLNPPSPADTLVSVLDASGNVIAENDDFAGSTDSALQVTIPKGGQYIIRIRDIAGRGGTSFLYRATVRLVSAQTMER